MLDLKNYQRHCIEELREFLAESRAQGDPDIAFYRRTHEKYRDLHGDPKVPFVCVRVPTGGGKTLIASHAVALAFEHYLLEKQEADSCSGWYRPTPYARKPSRNCGTGLIRIAKRWITSSLRVCGSWTS